MSTQPSSAEFATVREAKQFLADCIVAQATRQSIPLSEVEQKMLLWSETDDSIPDLQELNEAFDRECNTDEYEEKVASLIRDFRTYARTEDPDLRQRWNAALQRLKGGDHYILVLVSVAKEPSWLSERSGENFPMARTILLAVAFWSVIAFLYGVYLHYR